MSRAGNVLRTSEVCRSTRFAYHPGRLTHTIVVYKDGEITRHFNVYPTEYKMLLKQQIR